MSQVVSFEQTVRGGRVHGALQLPDAKGKPLPALLICEGVEADSTAMDDLWHGCAKAMLLSGIAVVRFQPRCSELIQDDFHAYTADDHLADLTAAVEWLAETDAVLGTALGLVGYGIGGATAACLAGQSDSIARLCLLSASVTGTDRPSKAKSNGDASYTGEGDTSNAPDQSPPRAYAMTLRDLAPAEQLCRFAGPLLLMHGAADRVIDPGVLFQWSDLAKGRDNEVETCFIARAEHHFDDPHVRAACIDRLQRFFMPLHPAHGSQRR